MSVVLGLLAFTVVLFVTEIVRIDVAAVLVMVILGGLTALITYAVYGVLLYAIRKAVMNME